MNRKIITRLAMLMILILLAGCDQIRSELASPCNHYGQFCHQVPINHSDRNL